MKTSSTFASDADALTTFLDSGIGPIIVLDPCGVLWNQFHSTQRWSRLWQAWRLAPGQTQEGDAWDVLGALSHVSATEGTAALAAAMFPPEAHTSLTRQLMACVLTFAVDSGHLAVVLLVSLRLPGSCGQTNCGRRWRAGAKSIHYIRHFSQRGHCLRMRGQVNPYMRYEMEWLSTIIRTSQKASRANVA